RTTGGSQNSEPLTGLVGRRFLAAVPLLFGISLVTFAILHFVPGGPLAAYAGNPAVTAEDLARLEHALGIDRPLPEQYLSWIGRLLTGDWGYSFATSQPVLAMIGERLPNTLTLMLTVYVVT